MPTSCSPVDEVRKRRSIGITLSNGTGIFHAKPGSVSTRTGLPKRVITPASPAGTITMQAAATAANNTSAATPKRTANSMR